MWRRYSLVLILVLAVSNNILAEEERDINGYLRGRSDFAVAGYIRSVDTLQLVYMASPHFPPSPLHFINSRTTDSLFRMGIRIKAKEDSIAKVKREKAFDAFVKKERAIARKQGKSMPVYGFMPEEVMTTFIAMVPVKRYRIEIKEIIKKGNLADSLQPRLRWKDTITVLVVPSRRWDTTSSINMGSVVIYYKPSENKTTSLHKGYNTPEMEQYYRDSKIYFIDPERIEKERWREVRVQY